MSAPSVASAPPRSLPSACRRARATLAGSAAAALATATRPLAAAESVLSSPAEPSSLALLVLLLAVLAAGIGIGLVVGRRRAAPLHSSSAAAASAAAELTAAQQSALANAERRRLHRALKQRMEMLDAAQAALFRTDGHGRIRFLNRAWTELSGYGREQSIGRQLSDFLHPDDHDHARQLLRELLANQRADCRAELRLRTGGGEVRWVELIAHCIGDADSADHGIAGTVSDVSARKVAELSLRNLNLELETRVRLRTDALEASNRELEAFSYSVSHDLRAPLRAIDGFSRILAEDYGDRLDEAAQGYLQRIRNATERMAILIDALINLASLTRKPLHKESVDLSALATTIVEELQAEQPDRAVEVEITRELVVSADRALMSVVLDNLLRNAWKFTARQARARIVFDAERDGEQRVFSVSDNGAGFDMDHADHLFRPFHRLHGTDDFPGTGIGLATVQRIVERHGGRIWAESRPQQGAIFRFTLGG